MSFIPVYILVLFVTIVIDYFAGIWMEDSPEPGKRKRYLLVSIFAVCAILFVFKYFNFFNHNIAALAEVLHWHYPIQSLQIILPIGLSFHTFQSLSYVIEVYRGHQKAERHFGIYALYVMYFPQLVAGPIERPQNLLPQFHKATSLDWTRVRDGLFLSLWGLFKKVVVADCLALYVDVVYNSYTNHTGTTLLLATYFFAFQIYCDFSGYSDIARGISRIYGIELMKNFETPYFATSIVEFWSRWHMSLSTWFKDYVYIPLGGNRVRQSRHYLNLLLVFLLSGFWHGANWTFVVWGALHGMYLIVERTAQSLQRSAVAEGERASVGVWTRIMRLLGTFHLVLIAWVFFRSENIEMSCAIVWKMLTGHGPLFWDAVVVQAFLVIGCLLVFDIFNRHTDYWNNLSRFSVGFKFSYAVFLLFSVVLLGMDSGTQFIYFQF